jgi:hypothetical protein
MTTGNIALIALSAVFLVWHSGRGQPFSPWEVESLLNEMKRRAGKPADEAEASILQEFRELAKSYDGREYYLDESKIRLHGGFFCSP